MVERICPACQHANPVSDLYCGKCGAPLERQVLARRGEQGLSIGGYQLPVSWRQVGKTAALGAAALVAEVGLVWLRRRLENGPTEMGITKSSTALAKRPTQREGGRTVTIVSQRQIDISRSADGNVQINDRHVWQKREE